MIPRITNYAYNTLAIPELSGGINKCDDFTKIEDNQLSDSVNMWYKDGTVKTRPAMMACKYDFSTANLKNTNKFITIGSETYFCLVDNDTSTSIKFISTNGIGECVTAELPCIVNVVNVFQYKEEVYVFCSDYKPEEDTPFYIYKITFESQNGGMTPTVIRIYDEDLYIPTIATNIGPITKTNETDYQSWEQALSSGGISYEGYNLIGAYYKVKYSTVKQYEPTVDNENTEDELIYRLPFSAAEVEGRRVTVKVQWSTHTAEYVVDINDSDEDGAYWGTTAAGGWWVRVKDSEFSFYDAKNGNLCKRKRKYYSQNDMEVTAPCPNSEDNYKKVLNMTFNEWYGGGAEGLYGGVHLFMGGNTEDKYKSLVLWSDINKPLYFSENCYAYVGEAAQKVSAFGKQGESLIVFKEHEIYSTKYVSNEVSENSTIVDITATDVVFPFSQVHGYIGCDCPDSVQLCRNRLVWLNSDGKVYTLVSANQYNERAVYEVSRSIHSELKSFSAEDLHNVSSADWNGHYILCFADKMLLMDYNSYGFSSVYSYSKEESAQRKIPWWIWKPYENVELKSLLSFQDNLYAICSSTECIAYFEESEKDLGSYPIYSMLQTKLFDFGLPTIKKNVPRIEVLLGGNDGNPINVTTITENGTDEEQIKLTADISSVGEAGYFQTAVIKPLNRINYRLGLKIETEGKLEVSDLVLQFKRLGGQK